MKKIESIILIILFSILNFSCSGVIIINFYGKIIGYNTLDSASYKFNFLNFGEVRYECIPKIDALGNYQMKMEFRNVPPQCISLLKNEKIVDRYCLDMKGNEFQDLVNVFTGSQISTPNLNHWRDYEIRNLNFDESNYLKDSNILKFDSVNVSVTYIPENKLFEFKVNDPSNSISYISAYYYKSRWKGEKVDFDSTKFSIPEIDLPKHKYSFENMIFIRIYSKFGWYKEIGKTIWN
jgi:hypothetical protein